MCFENWGFWGVELSPCFDVVVRPNVDSLMWPFSRVSLEFVRISFLHAKFFYIPATLKPVKRVFITEGFSRAPIELVAVTKLLRSQVVIKYNEDLMSIFELKRTLR